jgi:hypothetical protein
MAKSKLQKQWVMEDKRQVYIDYVSVDDLIKELTNIKKRYDKDHKLTFKVEKEWSWGGDETTIYIVEVQRLETDDEAKARHKKELNHKAKQLEETLAHIEELQIEAARLQAGLEK